MHNILRYLTDLGFSDLEAKIYLALHKTGPMTVAALADSTKINRTATYSHINTLLEKGVIAKVKGSSSKIAANPPEQLHILVEQKAIHVGMLQEKLPNIVASLNTALPPMQSTSPNEIKYYRGKTAVKSVYRDILKSQEVRSYFSLEDIEKIFPENYKLFGTALKNNPKVTHYELCEDSQLARRRMQINFFHKQRHYKFLPSDIKLTANDILIYQGNVAIINMSSSENIHAAVISNQDYYNNSKQIFDLLWRLLPEAKK